MSLLRRHATDVLNDKGKEKEDNVEQTQFEFDRETQRVYRQLKSELQRLKMENKINSQLNKMLSERLSKLNE